MVRASHPTMSNMFVIQRDGGAREHTFLALGQRSGAARLLQG
jgi:hypothetical protein